MQSIMKNFFLNSVLGPCFLMLAASSCTAEITKAEICEDEPLIIGLSIDSDATKSYLDSNGTSVRWCEGDEIALWAESGSNYSLEAQRFCLYGSTADKGVFTSRSSEAMTPGSYTYYVTYPYPESFSSNNAVFNIPSVQHGKAAGGEDIMLSSPQSYTELLPLSQTDGYVSMKVGMNHLMHAFRFFLPYGEDSFGTEGVQKIELEFPRNVVGKLSLDVTDFDSAILTEGSNRITLELDEPLTVSGLSSRKYAYALFFPTQFTEGEALKVKLYSKSGVSVLDPIDLQARFFAPGHATSVKLEPQGVSELYSIEFRIASNNLGEDVGTVTLTAPEGCDWGSGSNVYTISSPTAFKAGDSFVVEMEDEAAYRSLSNATITVTYDSEHVISQEILTIPDTSSGTSADVSLNVPWLLFEDFSGVESFSSNDNYTTSSAGSKNAVSFLDGWTGGRIGASKGESIRIACRRETSSDYNARVDSKPVFTIKKAVSIDVSFDYGANNKYGGISIITNGDVGQTLHLGYVTSTEAYKSGDESGVFQNGNSFYIKEYTGSYTNLPNSITMTIDDFPAGSTNRITWRTVIEHQAGTHNTTAWFYIDNVKVRVSANN